MVSVAAEVGGLVVAGAEAALCIETVERVFAVEALDALDPRLKDLRVDAERVAVEDHEVGVLARFERADARALVGDPRFDRSLGDTDGAGVGFDAAISLCQGAFGLGGPPDVGDPQNLAADTEVLRGIAAALRPGGRCAVSAFSSYFQVRWLEESDTFDAAGGVNHERTELRDSDGARAEADLWTTCYTPRELRLVAERVGLVVDHIWSVTPGGYDMAPPSVDTHEFLLTARTPLTPAF